MPEIFVGRVKVAGADVDVHVEPFQISAMPPFRSAVCPTTMQKVADTHEISFRLSEPRYSVEIAHCVPDNEV
jgi:hypothetical protein